MVPMSQIDLNTFMTKNLDVIGKRMAENYGKNFHTLDFDHIYAFLRN